MKNRHVGYIVLGISLVMLTMVLLFDNLIRTNVGLSCSHGPMCGMYEGINIQTRVSFIITGVIFLIGLFLVLVREEKEIIIKRVKEKKKKISLEGLNENEKKALSLIYENKGIFQAELMEKLGIGKVGITRLLDKLESKGIVERKRRGMNNFIVLR